MVQLPRGAAIEYRLVLKRVRKARLVRTYVELLQVARRLNAEIDTGETAGASHGNIKFKNPVLKDHILQSVPGVGPQTSAMLIANLPELGTLNRQEIAALAGLAPWDRSSGKSNGQMHIWGGRKDVRSVLYMAAFTACRFNPVIRSFAERLRDNGKAYKVIITACMRKLLVILNTMIRTQTLWIPKISPKNS